MSLVLTRAVLVRLASVLLVLGFVLGDPARVVQADARELRVAASVMIVLGSSQGAGSDAALERIEALRRPPFDSFTKKALLKRADLQLTQGKEVELELPNGRRLRLALIERTPDGRYRLAVSINRPGKQDYLPVMKVIAAPGDPFFVAGQRHEGGTLIIGISVGKTS